MRIFAGNPARASHEPQRNRQDNQSLPQQIYRGRQQNASKHSSRLTYPSRATLLDQIPTPQCRVLASILHAPPPALIFPSLTAPAPRSLSYPPPAPRSSGACSISKKEVICIPRESPPARSPAHPPDHTWHFTTKTGVRSTHPREDKKVKGHYVGTRKKTSSVTLREGEDGEGPLCRRSLAASAKHLLPTREGENVSE